MQYVPVITELSIVRPKAKRKKLELILPFAKNQRNIFQTKILENENGHCNAY